MTETDLLNDALGLIGAVRVTGYTATVKDIAWAAGFLEGEGCFTPGGYGRKRGSSPWIGAAQVQREPLERLQKMFGGSISKPALRKDPKHQPCQTWVLSARRAAGLMMTIYPLMSPRRKGQIEHSLSCWKERPVERKYRTHCPLKHEYTEANTYTYRGSRSCRKCRNIKAKACHKADREALNGN